jgi:hypothetical protein
MNPNEGDVWGEQEDGEEILFSPLASLRGEFVDNGAMIGVLESSLADLGLGSAIPAQPAPPMSDSWAASAMLPQARVGRGSASLNFRGGGNRAGGVGGGGSRGGHGGGSIARHFGRTAGSADDRDASAQEGAKLPTSHDFAAVRPGTVY